MILYRPIKWQRYEDWRLTQAYWVNFQVNGKRYYGDIIKGWKKHEWIDYAWPKPGDKIPCYSAVNGVVKKAWFETWFWLTVWIEFDWHELVYGHLSRIDVNAWDKISINQQVWIIWTTWTSTGVHLHFGLRPIWKWWINPTPYIRDWDVSNVANEAISANSALWEETSDENLKDLLHATNNYIRKSLNSNESTWETLSRSSKCPHTPEELRLHKFPPQPKDGVITYRVHNETADMPSVIQNMVFNNMFTYIEEDLNNEIRFVRLTNEVRIADINIRFAYPWDPNLPAPFKASSLAYAIMPIREIWINDSKDFTRWFDRVRLLSVLDHEARHILWVDHVDDENDIMYFAYHEKEIASPTSWDILRSNYGIVLEPKT